jgi:hypothetical protein
MAVRKKLVYKVAEQIAEVPTNQFIVIDVTDALISSRGKPLATNSEVSAIIRCHGLAQNTGVSIKRGDGKYTVWKKFYDTQIQPGEDEDDYDSMVKTQIH